MKKSSLDGEIIGIELFRYSSVNLFEIDEAGKIIYCRTGNDIYSAAESAKVIGRDLFSEVSFSDNTEEFVRVVKSFIRSRQTTGKFEFIFCVESRKISATVEFQRMTVREDGSRIKAVCLDIRKI